MAVSVIKKLAVSAVAVSLLVGSMVGCDGGAKTRAAEAYAARLVQIKETAESGIMEQFQERVNGNPAYRGYGVKTQKVALEPKEDDPYSYKGTVTFSVDADIFDIPQDTAYEISISAKSDTSGVFEWEMDNKTLEFLDDLAVKPAVPNIEMVPVKGGRFMIGCTPEQGNDCGSYEKPSIRKTVRDFSISKYEITQMQWKQVMGSNPSHFKGNNLPVESINWNDVHEFIKKLNTTSGKKYRLLTEEEWEYAARGGDKSGKFKYSGSNNIDDVAWYYANAGDKTLDVSDWDTPKNAIEKAKENNNRTHIVGTKQPNELGIHDMSGNVFEWISGYFVEYGGEHTWGRYRMYRGGGKNSSADMCRVSARFGTEDIRERSKTVGLRLALSQ